MNKFKNKKGFSLIEMLIVIAIVAALVSIIVPTVQEATLKSRAATNAANLREVEAALSTLRVSNYDDFMTASANIEAYLGPQLSSGAIALLNRFDGLGDALKNAMCTMKATNGVLILDLTTSGRIEISAPGAKEVKVNGEHATLYCAKDTTMQIFVTENAITCLYDGYSKEDFADVAEDGKYDAEAKQVSGGQVVVDKITCATAGHNWGADGGSTVCLRAGCGASRCASTTGCNQAATIGGYCASHYASEAMCQYKVAGITACTSPATSGGYCASHQLKTCTAKKSYLAGGGTCNTEYRGSSCPNSISHSWF